MVSSFTHAQFYSRRKILRCPQNRRFGCPETAYRCLSSAVQPEHVTEIIMTSAALKSHIT